MNPYLILGIGIAWLASLVGVGYWQNEAGHVAERVEWQKKDSDELRLANAEITRLNDKARADEREHTERLATVSTTYQKELKNANAQRERDVAAARAGALRLQFRPDSDQACSGGTGEATTAASGRDGGTTAELPREITANLLNLANDADAVVVQLTACQAVVRSDRGEATQ